MRYRDVGATGSNLTKHSLRYGDLTKKDAQQLKIAQRRQIYKRTGVRDDQGYPILRRLSNSAMASASASQSSAV